MITSKLVCKERFISVIQASSCVGHICVKVNEVSGAKARVWSGSWNVAGRSEVAAAGSEDSELFGAYPTQRSPMVFFSKASGCSANGQDFGTA